MYSSRASLPLMAGRLHTMRFIEALVKVPAATAKEKRPVLGRFPVPIIARIPPRESRE
jgi:hypothetical protein